MKRWSTKILIIGCVVASAAASPPILGPAAAVPMAAEAPTSTAEAPDLQQLAALKMVEDHGITLDDALDQLAAQDATNQAASLLSTAVPKALWGGAYIDHGNRGRLVVLVTNRLSLLGLRVAIGYDIRTVTRSLLQLDAVKKEIEAVRDSQGLAVMVSVDIETNRVELRPIGAEGAAQLGQIQAVAEGHRGAAAVVEGIDGIEPSACSGTYQLCEVPLRGGLAMLSQTGGVNCTAGFIVRSTSDDKPYVMTAGHCPELAGYSTNWRTMRPSLSPTLTTIGDRHNSEYGTATSSTLDTAIIDIDDEATWTPSPWVLVKASAMTTLNETYSMDGVGTTAGLAQYTYLCTTGAASATRCGQYFASGVTGADGVTNTAWVGFSSCGGDSGGPVYKSHLGYGTVHAYLGTITTVSVNTGLASYTTTCGTSSLYQGLTGALSAMNVALDT